MWYTVLSHIGSLENDISSTIQYVHLNKTIFKSSSQKDSLFIHIDEAHWKTIFKRPLVNLYFHLQILKQLERTKGFSWEVNVKTREKNPSSGIFHCVVIGSPHNMSFTKTGHRKSMLCFRDFKTEGFIYPSIIRTAHPLDGRGRAAFCFYYFYLTKRKQFRCEKEWGQRTKPWVTPMVSKRSTVWWFIFTVRLKIKSSVAASQRIPILQDCLRRIQSFISLSS